jgi:predicted ATP-grasp superfamily ATP-dependent carboligase
MPAAKKAVAPKSKSTATRAAKAPAKKPVATKAKVSKVAKTKKTVAAASKTKVAAKKTVAKKSTTTAVKKVAVTPQTLVRFVGEEFVLGKRATTETINKWNAAPLSIRDFRIRFYKGKDLGIHVSKCTGCKTKGDLAAKIRAFYSAEASVTDVEKVKGKKGASRLDLLGKKEPVVKGLKLNATYKSGTPVYNV